MTAARRAFRTEGDLQARHRRRLLAPLLAGKTVLELEPSVSNTALPLLISGGRGTDAVLQLTPVSAADLARQATTMMALLPPDGIAVVTCRDAVPAAALRTVALHHAHYVQRAVMGSLFVPGTFSTGRVAVLRDGANPAQWVHVYIFARQALPPLETGVLEAGGAACPPPANLLTALPQTSTDVTAPADALEDRAASLVQRLFEQEARLLALFGQVRQLEAASAQPGAGGQAQGFEPPSARHSWRLARVAGGTPPSKDPYDCRVDDPVIHAARQGEAFFAANGLGLPGANAGAAVDALRRRANLLAAADGATPVVSIIIPVYGQLAYTLNCLDSLFAHASRHSAEIIIVDDCSPDASGALLPLLPQIRYHRQPRNGGFIASCNTGAAMARGDFILMLNNDTRVVDGWLDALIDSFTAFPNAGLVGSKMLYADGSLQEAGGILWRDGSAWNYGRNDDPNRPHYAYARQVDYVSGCSIALRLTDWRALGGFDPYFHPAYCEDADLCLRIRQAGREVWYQPQSRIVHYEGKTSGTDTASGVKAYQIVNSKKLFLRWRDQLAGHRANGDAAYFEKDRAVKRRMLVIDATTPTPDQDAGSLQTVLGLQACTGLGYGTAFVPEDNFLFQQGYTTDLQAMGIECAYAPYELSMDVYLRRYGRLFDVIMVYRVTVLEEILPMIQAHAPQAVLIYHVADLHFLRMEREAALARDPDLLARAADMRAQELDLVKAADCTITHSHFEAGLLNTLVPEAAVTVWPLMYPVHGTQIGFAARRNVVFLGGYRHSPNVDAVTYFCSEILPRLNAAEPELRLIAAGANPSAEIAVLASPRVEVTGQIADLGPLLDGARVFVCPLRVGAGVKGKIMTALAHGIPVVSTSIGIEGSGLQPGVHVLVADDPESFARETLRLYRDRDLWQRLSTAGLQLMEQEFSPTRGKSFLADAIGKAWARKLDLN